MTMAISPVHGAHALPSLRKPSLWRLALIAAYSSSCLQQCCNASTPSHQRRASGASGSPSRMHDAHSHNDVLDNPYIAEDGIVLGPVSPEEQAEFAAQYDDSDAYDDEYADTTTATSAGILRASDDDSSAQDTTATGTHHSQPLPDDTSVLSRTARRLQKKRNPARFTACNRCTITKCPERGACTGKCKKKRRLFNCKSSANERTCQRGGTLWWVDNPVTIPADALEPLSTVILSTTPEYIACANITNRPSGCPGPDSHLSASFSSSSSDTSDHVLLGSRCVTQLYRLFPNCESPLFPFGVCMCEWSDPSRPQPFEAPCNPSSFDLPHVQAPDGPGEGAGQLLSDSRVYLEVASDSGGDAVSYTRFSDYADDNDGPTYSYSVKFSAGEVGSNSSPFNVSMDYYHTYWALADTRAPFTATATILPDYEDSPELKAYDEEVEDYYWFDRYISPGIQDCLWECYWDGSGVLGTIDADYYSVQYHSRPDCPHCFDYATEGGLVRTVTNYTVTTYDYGYERVQNVERIRYVSVGDDTPDSSGGSSGGGNRDYDYDYDYYYYEYFYRR